MVKNQQKAEIRICGVAGAYLGFNGIEPEVVGKIGAWIGAVKTCAGAINPGKALGYDA